jgi:hypothetical protein
MAPVWSRAFRWPWSLESVWLVAPFAVVTLVLAAKPIPPHDYWWHLVLGREIAATGSIPRANLYLYSLPADLPFHDLPWLAQWLMFQLYALAGHHGNALALSACVLVGWWLLFDAALRRCDRVRVVAPIAVVSVLLSTPALAVRPQMFVFPLYAVLLSVLFGVADERLSRRWLWALPVCGALWANLHGSFVLCPMLIGAVGAAHLIARRCRVIAASWAGVTLVAVVAGLMSPVGRGNYAYVLTGISVRHVSEWQPPNASTGQGAAIWVAIALACLTVLLSLRRVRWHELALLGLVTLLAGSALRHVLWFAASLPIVLPRLLAERLPRGAATGGVPVLNAGFAVGLLAIVLTLQPGLLLERARIRLLSSARASGAGKGLLTEEHPLALAERLKRDPPAGRLFHEQRVGGLVEFHLTAPGRPEPVAFVDQRMDLIPDAVWQEYFAISTAEDWQRRLNELGVTALLLHEGSQRKLLQAAHASPAWREVDREGPYRLLLSGPSAAQ